MTARFEFSVTGGTEEQRSTVLAAANLAGAAWSPHLPTNTVITLPIEITTLEGNTLAWGSSVTTVQLGPTLWEPITPYELRTGQDSNGDQPDGAIRIDLVKSLSGGANLVDELAHEIGHVLGFDQFADGVNRTTFEAQLRDGFFIGSAAQAIYGGPVPVGMGPHYTIAGLMNPFEGGWQGVAAQDIAFISDMGVPVSEQFGTLGPDILYARAGGDTVYGGFGDDQIFGSMERDLALGGAGADRLEGRAGADTLSGEAGADSLAGGKGDDRLLGGPGEDTLAGQLGDDVLTGGEGNDLFLFGADGGVDHITDFQIGRDRIQFAQPYIVAAIGPAGTLLRSGTTDVVIDFVTYFDPAWVGVSA